MTHIPTIRAYCPVCKSLQDFWRNRHNHTAACQQCGVIIMHHKLTHVQLKPQGGTDNVPHSDETKPAG